jgi:hypothetical protein
MTTQVTSSRPTGSDTTPRTARAVVPWPTVLALGALLAYTDGFWTTSLREAVGSIERTSEPFSAWLRESTLLVPLFALGVLVAITLARRRYGPVLRGRTLLAAVLLVVAAGTLAGVAELAVSSWFDYRLQLAGLERMGTMGGQCTGECLESQREATLLLQLKSVGYGSAILLGSNLVLVGWALALMGGRLSLQRTTDRPRPGRDRRDDLRRLVALGLGGSALVHAALVPRGVLESPATGVVVVTVAVLQLLAADQALGRPGPRAWWCAVAVCSAPLLLVALAPTFGVMAAAVLEILVLAGAAVLLRMPGWASGGAVSAHAGWVAVLAIVALTAVGAGSGLGLYGGRGPEHQLAPHKTTSQSQAVAQGER